MTPERWSQIKEIFNAVLEKPADIRRSALAELSHGDPAIESEVERLLAQHDEMGGFLESSAEGAAGDGGHLLVNGDVLAGRYQILDFLGSGGMGEVYEVQDRELNERVALKVIRQGTPFDSGVVDRLRREVQLARRVTHPNVCRVFDLGHDQRQGQELIFLTMELIKGETLSERLKREGKLKPAEALVIAGQLCDALDAAHQASVLHRDFKPGNVMLIGRPESSETSLEQNPAARSSSLSPRAVVTDFGIARGISAAKASGSNSTMSVTGTQGLIAGTPAYMSPEQLLGEKLTPASDIYSLGLVLYEMVTGTRPFQGQSSWTEGLKRLSTAPTAPVTIVPELDQRWDRTILRCLERDPAKRFQSAREVAEFLTGERSFSSSLSRAWQIAVASCLLLAAAAAFLFHDRIWPVRLPAQKHVAVLPFAIQGRDAANQATAYELSESLTANLSRLQTSDNSMWVVPWSVVRNQKPDDLGHAASSLGANLLITGELKRGNDTVRLRTEVRDASSLRSLGSQTIEVPVVQVASLEDRLLQQVSSMLRLHVPPEVLQHLSVGTTAEAGAYDFYEQGRGYLLRFNASTPEEGDRAIALLQTAIEKDPNFALAYASLAYAYVLKFRGTRDSHWLDKAKQNCDKALSLNDKLAPAHRSLGTLHQESGDLDGAIREYEQALQLDPTDDQTLYWLSMAYDKTGQLLKAEALLKDALKRTPGSWVNYNYLGYFYYRHADYAQAEPLFRTATELAPDNPLAFYNLGGVYLAEGKYNDAETILTRAILIKPTAGAYSNLGLAYQYQGRYQDAAAMFQKASELQPDDDRYWCNLGTAYSLAGDKTKAADAYQNSLKIAGKVLAVRPGDAQFLSRMALYYAKLGRAEKAQEELAQAMRSSDNNPELLFNSVLTYELIGQRERALAALRSTLRAGYSLSEIQNAPELAQLRQDRRYAQIVGANGS